MTYEKKERKPDYPMQNGVHTSKGQVKNMKVRKTDWPRFVLHNYSGALRRPNHDTQTNKSR